MDNQEIKNFLKNTLEKVFNLPDRPSLTDDNWRFEFDMPVYCEWDGLDFTNDTGEIIQISKKGRVRIFDKDFKEIFKSQI